MISRLRIACPALLLLAAAAMAADDIKPEAILDKYVEVTGGRAAYEKIKTEVMTGTLEIAAIGINGTITIYQATPDRSYTVLDLGGMGKAEEGSDGHVAWSVNGMEGARIKEGDERAATLRRDALNAELHWHDFYKKAELAGTEDVGGKACYKVVMTPNEGSPETRYYDKGSNLLVKAVMSFTGPQGAVTVETAFSDYRDEGGILMPHTIAQKVPNADVLVKIESVKRNPEIAADRFELPAEIKALMTDKKPGEKKADEKKTEKP
jgi:outer membrane lipoprotein-sorting protein